MFADPDLFFATFFVLLFGHCLADFALQNDYTAKAKNPLLNSRYIWIPVMFAHCMIHAGIVYLVTGMLSLALFQLVTHFAIDWLKCEHRLGKGDKAFLKDQLLHVVVILITTIVYYFS